MVYRLLRLREPFRSKSVVDMRLIAGIETSDKHAIAVITDRTMSSDYTAGSPEAFKLFFAFVATPTA